MPQQFQQVLAGKLNKIVQAQIKQIDKKKIPVLPVN
jgi:hypothetical protein